MTTHKTALITGGAKRIGASLVYALHELGFNIVFQYLRSSNEAKKLATSLNQKRPESVFALHADLERFDNYSLMAQMTYEKFGRLDVLINNASGFFPTPINKIKQEDWSRIMNVNAQAPLFLAQHCRSLLRENSGSILNISDIYADHPLSEHSIYCASKAALNSITRSLAIEFAPQIRVNAIAPGAILAPHNADESAMQLIINKTPVKRLGGCQSIVETALFLINHASFITGQVIKVDGGRSINGS